MVREFGFLPPSQGSVKEILYDWNCTPLDVADKLRRCPSPDGKGDQAPFLNIFLAEKLLKETLKFQ